MKLSLLGLLCLYLTPMVSCEDCYGHIPKGACCGAQGKHLRWYRQLVGVYPILTIRRYPCNTVLWISTPQSQRNSHWPLVYGLDCSECPGGCRQGNQRKLIKRGDATDPKVTFKAMDTNNDGKITAVEYSNYMQLTRGFENPSNDLNIFLNYFQT